MLLSLLKFVSSLHTKVQAASVVLHIHMGWPKIRLTLLVPRSRTGNKNRDFCTSSSSSSNNLKPLSQTDKPIKRLCSIDFYAKHSKRFIEMGSLATHFSAFLFLFPIGIRRLLCSFSLYLKNPSLYRSKPWYLSEPRWKNFDLYILLIALPIASFSEIFLFLTFSGHPTFRFAFFQESAVVLLFWVLLVLVILRDHFDPFLIHESFVFVFAGIVFLMEISIMDRGFTGPASRIYELLKGLTLVCAACCFYLSFKPTAFFAEFALSLGIVFKGTWVLQAGLSLFSDIFSLKGCEKIVLSSHENTNLRCDLEEDSLRGVAVINLLFVGHATVALVVSIVLFGALSRNRNLRCGEGSGYLMAEIESQTLLMHPFPEFEIE